MQQGMPPSARRWAMPETRWSHIAVVLAGGASGCWTATRRDRRTSAVEGIGDKRMMAGTTVAPSCVSRAGRTPFLRKPERTGKRLAALVRSKFANLECSQNRYLNIRPYFCSENSRRAPSYQRVGPAAPQLVSNNPWLWTRIHVVPQWLFFDQGYVPIPSDSTQLTEPN